MSIITIIVLGAIIVASGVAALRDPARFPILYLVLALAGLLSMLALNGLEVSLVAPGIGDVVGTVFAVVLLVISLEWPGWLLTRSERARRIETRLFEHRLYAWTKAFDDIVAGRPRPYDPASFALWSRRALPRVHRIIGKVRRLRPPNDAWSSLVMSIAGYMDRLVRSIEDDSFAEGQSSIMALRGQILETWSSLDPNWPGRRLVVDA